MRPVDADELAFQAFRDEQLGRFADAMDGYRRSLVARPNHLFAATRLLRLQRDRRADSPGRPTIVWQIPLDTAWESDWVRYLLSGLDATEVVDGRHVHFVDGSIVVDNHLDQRKRDYYFEMLRRGHRFVLFHLSGRALSRRLCRLRFCQFRSPELLVALARLRPHRAERAAWNDERVPGRFPKDDARPAPSLGFRGQRP